MDRFRICSSSNQMGWFQACSLLCYDGGCGGGGGDVLLCCLSSGCCGIGSAVR